uniref:Erythrocyte membrane protein 1 n=1 Tax=Rhipicephalus appendiculatus TaxID=34631 RepID=A0A131YEX2_RHIAP
MTHTARSVDITELSGDIIKLVFKGNKAFVRYMDPETAAANLKIIEKAVGKGKVLRVERCTTRKQTTLGNMLDLFRLPFNCTVARLKQQFPCSRVCVLKHGFARLCFNSTEDLKRAVQRPGCHTIDGHQIRLSLVKELAKEDDYRGGGRQSRDSRGDYDYNGRGGRGWKRNWPVGRAFWRGGGGRGGRGGGPSSSRMGSRASDWDSGGRGDWSEVEDWDSRAWRGGSRFFWNSGGRGRRGRRGGRRGSWGHT